MGGHEGGGNGQTDSNRKTVPQEICEENSGDDGVLRLLEAISRPRCLQYLHIFVRIYKYYEHNLFKKLVP